MSRNIDPELQAQYDYETQFIQSQTRGSRRVKLDRGKQWLIRFLPATLGPKGTWYARIARHWLAMKPIVCPKYTSPDFGGDPDAYCPCCELTEILNESGDEHVSKIGYNAKASPQWLTYCVVWEKDGVVQSRAENLIPYEFQHYKNTFEELMGFFRAGLRRGPLSVLDYKLGNDFSVSRTGKGTRLDKQDSAPIFDPSDPTYASDIAKIEAAMKTPKIKIPTGDELQTFALKIEEASNRQDGEIEGGGSRRRSRRNLEDDDGMTEADEDDGAQASRTVARRTTSVRDQEEDDSHPELSPVKRAPVVQPAPVRPARRAAEAEAEPEQEEAQAEPVKAALVQRGPLPPSPNRQRAAAAAAAAAAPAATAPVRPARRAAEAAPASSAVEEDAEEEAVPEEATDAAPPAEADIDEGAAEPPPQVARKELGSSIKGRIQSMARRGA